MSDSVLRRETQVISFPVAVRLEDQTGPAEKRSFSSVFGSSLLANTDRFNTCLKFTTAFGVPAVSVYVVVGTRSRPSKL
jgi:hypothetical protein